MVAEKKRTWIRIGLRERESMHKIFADDATRESERERESETMRLHQKLKKDKEVQILLQMFVNLSVLIITRTACT